MDGVFDIETIYHVLHLFAAILVNCNRKSTALKWQKRHGDSYMATLNLIEWASEIKVGY